jgi:hypothetical protein
VTAQPPAPTSDVAPGKSTKRAPSGRHQIRRRMHWHGQVTSDLTVLNTRDAHIGRTVSYWQWPLRRRTWEYKQGSCARVQKP